MDIGQFSKIVPYLNNPLALIGFWLFLFFGIIWAIPKSGLLSRLSQRQSFALFRQSLKYGFLVSITLIIFGIVYAGLFGYRDTNGGDRQQGPITQQAGDCGSNIVGDSNQVSVDCRERESKTK